MLKQFEVNNIYIGEVYSGPLRFKAEEANSTIQLTKKGSPTTVNLETSSDGNTWSSYTIGDTITLSNVGDKVYWRNSSETTTGFGTSTGDYYTFVMSGSISASGDVNYLLNKNSTDIINNYCYAYLFKGCSALISAPYLPAKTLASYCYYNMFSGCTSLTIAPILSPTTLAARCCASMFLNCSNLETINKLSIISLPKRCYQHMFNGCSKIKLSTSKTGEYQTEYRIPATGTGTVGTDSLYYMFTNTGGTFTGTPSINTTYYTSNTVV